MRTHPNVADIFHNFTHSMQSIVKILILQTILIKWPKPENADIIPHHSEQETHHMNNKASIVEGPPDLMAFFTVFPYEYIIMTYTTLL